MPAIGLEPTVHEQDGEKIVEVNLLRAAVCQGTREEVQETTRWALTVRAQIHGC